MEYIKTLEHIFANLQDHRTLEGIRLQLREATNFQAITTKRGTQLSRYWNNQLNKNMVYLLRDKVVKYDPLIESFILEFTNYLNNSRPELQNVIFSQVYAKIASYKDTLPYYDHARGIDFSEFQDDIDLLIKSGELEPNFETELFYDDCTQRREQKRMDVLFAIEDKVKDIQISIGNAIDENEPYPDYVEYKSHAAKIAWLKELGVLQTVLNHCRAGNGYNYTRAANILHSFIDDIHVDTFRQNIAAIYNPNTTNFKNNPLNNPDNGLFVLQLREKFKINKVE
ncbi:MAG: hypothetical protein ACJ75B_06630 [Flavisolibacter sp.]